MLVEITFMLKHLTVNTSNINWLMFNFPYMEYPDAMDASCNWIREHPEVWMTWMRPESNIGEFAEKMVTILLLVVLGLTLLWLTCPLLPHPAFLPDIDPIYHGPAEWFFYKSMRPGYAHQAYYLARNHLQIAVSTAVRLFCPSMGNDKALLTTKEHRLRMRLQELGAQAKDRKTKTMSKHDTMRSAARSEISEIRLRRRTWREESTTAASSDVPKRSEPAKRPFTPIPVEIREESTTAASNNVPERSEPAKRPFTPIPVEIRAKTLRTRLRRAGTMSSSRAAPADSIAKESSRATPAGSIDEEAPKVPDVALTSQRVGIEITSPSRAAAAKVSVAVPPVALDDTDAEAEAEDSAPLAREERIAGARLLARLRHETLEGPTMKREVRSLNMAPQFSQSHVHVAEGDSAVPVSIIRGDAAAEVLFTIDAHTDNAVEGVDYVLDTDMIRMAEGRHVYLLRYTFPNE